MSFLTGRDDMIAEWILLTVALALIVLRIYVRLFRERTKLFLSDIILIIAGLDGIALIITDTLTFHVGAMDNDVYSVELSKISFASNYFYDVGMGFPKMSMLAFYWGIFPASRPKLRWALYTVTAYVYACYLTILFDDTFYCGGNVSVQWSQADGACNVFYAPDPFYINFALNLSCYIFVYALPLFLLKDVAKDLKIGILATFFMGFATLVICAVRFATLETVYSQPNFVYLFSMLEMALALITTTLPGLKSLLKRGTSIEDPESSGGDSHDDKITEN
ncbi:hypothetical protein BP6252_11103 [Coleophoma cylindrospora]|uniref:Rhodopsin domain-containing protein n=1 Tax=Coleophoma cylindrospora TaxID=1849047 RepID=A0A3D8QPE9_9HELO|nr:hypothetical protein BP6252_11103 [Coleophoma cylindrospora]